MTFARRLFRRNRRGVAMILSMIFILVFCTLALSMATLSGTNAQLASNQHKVNEALAAAQSGIECGKYILSTAVLPETGQNFVSDAEADTVWTNLCTHLQTTALDGQSVPSATQFTDAADSGDQITTQSLSFGSATATFRIRFYRYYNDRSTIKVHATGSDGEVTRGIGLDSQITKDSQVLNYAVATRGRMWLTGDTTIHGDVFSSWNRAEISPYNMTSDSTVNGTINTVLTLAQIEEQDYQMETLDANDQPIFDADGDRVYNPEDQVKAYHEGINYGVPYDNMPGMDISDYSTDMYNYALIDIPSCPTALRRVEYFPHAPGNYSYPATGTPTHTTDLKLTRHVYENQTFTNTRLPDNRNALFKNCTFNGILYVDCYKSTSTYYNNVRFENCAFNGTIITDVPQILKWKQNCLYFTGTAAFDNQSGIEEATILAPHFNVNLGNTNPQQSDNNVLTGAIVGGIVDIRGNAQIYGTIISMCDTTQWTSGYVTNIGATLTDGGSETTELGDVGVITITPADDQMLPSGITSPIIIKPLKGTYSEGI